MRSAPRTSLTALALAAATSMGGVATADDDHSVARRWNDLILESIRNDRARPVVHARNLFHMSAAMWDAWSTWDDGDAAPDAAFPDPVASVASRSVS